MIDEGCLLAPQALLQAGKRRVRRHPGRRAAAVRLVEVAALGREHEENEEGGGEKARQRRREENPKSPVRGVLSDPFLFVNRASTGML